MPGIQTRATYTLQGWRVTRSLREAWMARPKKDISQYLGKRIEGTMVTVIREAGHDSRGCICVIGLCDCGKKRRMVLTELLSGHTVSCRCRKHENHVQFTQRAVDRLTLEDLRDCFLSTVDSRATKPDLPRRVITSAFIRYRDALKARLENDLAGVRKKVLDNRPYTDIAKEFNLHPAEVAWLAKHVIRPEEQRRRERKEDALNAIRLTKGRRDHEREDIMADQHWRQKHRVRKPMLDYEEWLRAEQLKVDIFSKNELHDPRTKASQKARLDPFSLDSAWKWMREEAPHMELSAEDQELVNWFHEASERTFRWRRDQRRAHAKQKSGKPSTARKQADEPDVASMPIEYDVAA